MSILTPRPTYGPFEYEWAYDAFVKQQSAHWLPWEVQMASDINDWKSNLTESDKNIIGSILKGFTQTEIFIGNDYWSSKVVRWFKKPEIQMMATSFASMEAIHAAGYSYLEESLGIQNYEAFLYEPTAKAKIDRLMNTGGKSKQDIAKSLAIFSAFNEGVNLFSSFAVLLSFSMRNLLKGVGQIVTWSIRDESLHSSTGCKLFNQLIKEYPDIWTNEFKKEIYDSARLTIDLEDEFINTAFKDGDLFNLTAKDLKTYIRYRANSKLVELGLKINWKNLDKDAIERLQWFDVLASGKELQDFFAGRVTTYSKSTADFTGVWNVKGIEST